MNWNDVLVILTKATDSITRIGYCVLVTALTAELALASLLLVRRQLEKLGAYWMMDQLGRIITAMYLVPAVFFAIMIRHMGFASGDTSGMQRVRGDNAFDTVGWMWAAVLIFLAIWLFIAGRRLYSLYQRRAETRRWLAGSFPAETELQDKMDVMAARMGLRRSVELRRSYSAHVALTCGVFRPRVIIPCDVFSDQKLAVIFAHELAHVRRRDVPVRLFLDIAEALFWFCPLIHRLPPLLIRWSETCTDIRAGELAGGARDYFSTMTTMVPTNPQDAQGAVCMIGEDGLEERLNRMKNFQKAQKRKGRLTIVAALCALTVLCGSVTALAAGETVAAASNAVCRAMEAESTAETAFAQVNDGVEYTAGPRESDDNVVIGNVIEGYYSTYKSLGWTVQANYICETPYFAASNGGYIHVVLEMEPSDVTVYVGIEEPDRHRRYCIVAGSIDHTFTLTKGGAYKVYVENISQTTDVDVYGGYFYQ